MQVRKVLCLFIIAVGFSEPASLACIKRTGGKSQWQLCEKLQMTLTLCGVACR